VKTDTATTTVSFNYAKPESEMKSKLDELAKNNDHLRDWKKKS
jgi:hypothetical protein